MNYSRPVTEWQANLPYGFLNNSSVLEYWSTGELVKMWISFFKTSILHHSSTPLSQDPTTIGNPGFTVYGIGYRSENFIDTFMVNY